MGRWGGTGPDSGAEGPLRGSARRVGDGTGGAERGAGLALSVLPFLPDPLQAHRHPAQGAEPGPGDPGGGRPGGPSAPAALHPAAPVRRGGAGTHPGPAGHSPAPGHAVSRPWTRTPRSGQRRSWTAWWSGGFLTPQQGAAVDPGQLSAFFNSPLGREMASAPVCRREFKFSVLLPAAELLPRPGAGGAGAAPGRGGLPGSRLWRASRWWTSRATGSPGRGAAARAEEYRPQLEAYSRALEEITGKPVVRQVLWFFEPGELILL